MNINISDLEKSKTNMKQLVFEVTDAGNLNGKSRNQEQTQPVIDRLVYF
jgi:hypothetical protein